MLCVGGLFILEPQQWKSYKKKKNICAHVRQTVKNIKIMPNMFREFLEGKMKGSEEMTFELIKTLKPNNKQTDKNMQDIKQQHQQQDDKKRKHAVGEVDDGATTTTTTTGIGFERTIFVYRKKGRTTTRETQEGGLM
eukprot:GHVS01096004.1.p1 GENE.GHVS01096004.1~~GHVS01096004.1.p1  ORF type:complete len:137 (+),score=38.14 GHVS01096004.1:615-1025(+)